MFNLQLLTRGIFGLVLGFGGLILTTLALYSAIDALPDPLFSSLFAAIALASACAGVLGFFITAVLWKVYKSEQA
jgi:hypothetical protein